MRILTAAVFCSLALAGCNEKKNDTVIVAPPPAPAQPVRPEASDAGVYPDCKFGVVPPDQGGPARCAPPAVN